MLNNVNCILSVLVLYHSKNVVILNEVKDLVPVYPDEILPPAQVSA